MSRAASKSAWRCSRSTNGSPPPEALMKFAPRRKSSASVRFVICPMLLRFLFSADLVGQLVPALSLAHAGAQTPPPRLGRLLERVDQLSCRPGDVRVEVGQLREG